MARDLPGAALPHARTMLSIGLWLGLTGCDSPLPARERGAVDASPAAGSVGASEVQASDRTKSHALSATPLTAAIEPCRSIDSRTPVPIWQPTVSETGRPSSFPPGEDGQVIYIDLSFPSNAQLNCIGMEADKLYSFGFRNDEADPMQGGFAVNLRGGVTFANDTCYISGFYLNESAPGVHQGWFETFYGHIPKKDLALTTRYCLGEKRDETVPTLEPVDVR